MIEWAKLLLVDVLVPLAWPAVAMGAIWILREPLRYAIKHRIEKLKAGPVEVTLQVQQVPQLPPEKVIIIENPEPPTTGRPPLPPAPKL